MNGSGAAKEGVRSARRYSAGLYIFVYSHGLMTSIAGSEKDCPLHGVLRCIQGTWWNKTKAALCTKKWTGNEGVLTYALNMNLIDVIQVLGRLASGTQPLWRNIFHPIRIALKKTRS